MPNLSDRLDRVPRVPARARELCPSCVGFSGGQCDRCNGNGFVWVSPYDIRKGEQGIDEDELEVSGAR